MTQQVLLVIDAQVNIFVVTAPAYDADRLLHRIADLVQQAHRAGVPVIFVRNNGTPDDPDTPGSSGWELHPDLGIAAGDAIIDKFANDSFHETPLKATLDRLGAEVLVICGLQTDYCINATTRRAAQLGYGVILVEDGHSTFDGDVPAPEIIREHNRTLAAIAQLVPAHEIDFSE